MDQFIKTSKSAQSMIDLLNENPAGLDINEIAIDLDVTYQFADNLAGRFFKEGFFDMIYTDSKGVNTYVLTPEFKARYQTERASMFMTGKAPAAHEAMRVKMVNKARQYGVFGVLVAQAVA